VTDNDLNYYESDKLVTPLYVKHVAPPMHTGAIVGFILAILIPIIGLIVSWSAKRSIDRNHLAGRGLAVAGIVIGWLGTIIWTVALGTIGVILYGAKLIIGA